MGSPIGLWTATSGALAQSQNLDVVANNLANANTVGFKKDEPTFKEYLTAVENPPSPAIDIPRTAFKDSDFYHFDGRENAMVELHGVHTDHSQGSMKQTGAPYDLAIEGGGFFAVSTPKGIQFTRAGNFTVNAQGALVTLEGYPVMALADAAAGGAAQATQNQQAAAGGADANRAPAALNPFTAPAGSGALVPVDLRPAFAVGQKPTITPEGEVFVGEEQIAKLAVAEFVDPKLLVKEGAALYSNPVAANVARAAKNTRIHQGLLEQSNVNAVSELVNMMKANRLFESNMRAMRTYSDMAGKEANEVGKL